MVTTYTFPNLKEIADKEMKEVFGKDATAYQSGTLRRARESTVTEDELRDARISLAEKQRRKVESNKKKQEQEDTEEEEESGSDSDDEDSALETKTEKKKKKKAVARMTRNETRLDRQTKFLKAYNDEERSKNPNHVNVTDEWLRCGVCDKKSLEHGDKWGGGRRVYDWFIDCSVCGRNIHSDCSGVDYQLRGKVSMAASWVCSRCHCDPAKARDVFKCDNECVEEMKGNGEKQKRPRDLSKLKALISGNVAVEED